MQRSISPALSERATLSQSLTDNIIAEPAARTATPFEFHLTAANGLLAHTDADRVDRRATYTRAKSVSTPTGFPRTTRPRWPETFPKVLISTSIAKLKAHPDYASAKRGGDVEAGYRVVRGLFKPASIAALPRGAIIAPVVLRETAVMGSHGQVKGEYARLSARARVPFVQRPTCTIAEACAATGLGRTKLYELIGEGRIDSITIGWRRLVRVPSLLTLLLATPDL